jgi:hypothetical protein
MFGLGVGEIAILGCVGALIVGGLYFIVRTATKKA